MTLKIKEKLSMATNPLTNIEQAALNIILQPVNSFFNTLQQPGANQLTVVQALAQLQLALTGDLPALETVGISGLAAYFQQQVNNWANNLISPPA